VKSRLEAAEKPFLRSVNGYTILDKIRSEIIRKELDILGIQDVRTKYKQNWINHHCCVYTEKVLMMNRGTIRNMQSFIPKINLRN